MIKDISPEFRIVFFNRLLFKQSSNRSQHQPAVIAEKTKNKKQKNKKNITNVSDQNQTHVSLRLRMKGLVSEKTAVLQQWGSETRKFGIQRVDKAVFK